MPTDLEHRAKVYADHALKEITTDPLAYGITEAWDTIEEWIDFEFDGVASDQFKTPEERDALAFALWNVADLDTLNAPFAKAEG